MKYLFFLTFLLFSCFAFGQRIETIQSVAGDGDGGINSTATVVKITSIPTSGYFSLPTSATNGRTVTLLNLTGSTVLFDQIIVRDAGLVAYYSGMSSSPDVIDPTLAANTLTIMFDSFFWRALK